jgi:hypothetical protein
MAAFSLLSVLTIHTGYAQAVSPSYTMTVIPVALGQPVYGGIVGNAMNAFGEVTGGLLVPPTYTNPSPAFTVYASHAFVYRNGRTTDIGARLYPPTAATSTDPGTYPNVVNPANSTIGQYINLEGNILVRNVEQGGGDGFYRKNGCFTLFSIPQGAKSIYYFGGLNDFDQICGATIDPIFGFLLQADTGTFSTLPVVPNQTSSINDRGQILASTTMSVNFGANTFDETLPAVYSGGQVTVLQGFPGAQIEYLSPSGPPHYEGGDTWSCTALSNLGEVVGYSQAAGYTQIGPRIGQNNNLIYPVRYVLGKPVILGTGTVSGVVPITGTDYGKELVAAYVMYIPTAVNDFGDVVGTLYWEMLDEGGIPDGFEHSAPWVFLHGKMYALNTLIPSGSGFVGTAAVAINDAGQILVNGTYSSDTHVLGESYTEDGIAKYTVILTPRGR